MNSINSKAMCNFITLKIKNPKRRQTPFCLLQFQTHQETLLEFFFFFV